MKAEPEATLRRVTINYHHEDGSWWAESNDAPGWIAAGETFDEVRQLAREGIRFFLDEDVLVTEAGDSAPIAPSTSLAGAVSVSHVKARLIEKFGVPKESGGFLAGGSAGSTQYRFPRVRESV
jgi:predicted RNase H-like HicB family nuclease